MRKMVRESGKEGQTKPVEHHEEQKQRIPGQRDGTKLRERSRSNTRRPQCGVAWCGTAHRSNPLVLFNPKARSLHKPQSAPLTCRSRVTSVNWWQSPWQQRDVKQQNVYLLQVPLDGGARSPPCSVASGAQRVSTQHPNSFCARQRGKKPNKTH